MEYLELKNQIKEKLSEKVDFSGKQNLVELGLSSLQIMRLVNGWRKQGIGVQFGEVMEKPTLENWWKLIEEGKGKRKIRKRNRLSSKKQFPLTDVQYAYKVGRDDDQELGGIGCHAYQEFDGGGVIPEKLEQAWNLLQYHHPMLRAKFLENGLQEVMNKPYKEKIDIYDLREEKDFNKRLLEIRESLSHRKLQVEKGQVAGIGLSLLPDGKTRIHFDVDLLVADVQSFQIILRDLNTAYNDRSLPRESSEWDFSRYLEIIKNEDQEERKKAQEYWNNRLTRMPTGPDLPLAKQPSEIKNTRFTRRIIHLNKEDWNVLQDKVKKWKATPAMLLLAAYALVLGRWSSRKNFLINIPFFNRKTEDKGMEDVVADFTTLLLLEVNLEKSKTFSGLLNQIQDQVHRDMKYTTYSGVQVQRDYMRMYGDKQNIAPVVFACNLGTPLVDKEFEKTLGKFSYMISQTPGVWIDFQTYENDQGLMLTWDTVDELFPKGMIDDMISSLERCLHQLKRNDWNQMIDVLPEKQKKFVEEQRNVSLPRYYECLYERFLQNAEKNPDRVAIIDTGQDYVLTYRELRKKAYSCASFLVKNNIYHQPIAISMTRGCGQAIAALGILLSGNIYVPVSLNQPKDRRKLIYEKIGIKYAISDASHILSVSWPDNAQVWELEKLYTTDFVEILPEIHPEDSAYIIMTSGTTGFPKGVEICHGAAWNTIADINSRFKITSEDVVLGVSAMDFDLSVYDLFGILNCGGTLVTIPEERSRDAEYWLEQILKYHITIWNSVPILLDMLLIQAEAQRKILPLRIALLSGDWISMDLPSRLAQVTNDCRFIAMGGATEASIWSNFCEVRLPLPEIWKSIPYGRPLSNQSYRIVDTNEMDVPFWVEGELWIGGAGVGTYRGDKELIQRKFVKDNGIVWYKTGDKGRFWSDGTIEFLGREDSQVKIRGHRIELGEIETALKTVEQINNAVVEVSEGTVGDKYLVAFLQTDKNMGEPLFEKKYNLQERIENRWNTLTNIKQISLDEKKFQEVLRYGELKTCQIMLKTLYTLGDFKSEKAYSYEEILFMGKIVDTQQETLKKWLSVLVFNGFIQEVEGKYCFHSVDDKNDKKSNFDKMDSYFDKLISYLPGLMQGIEDPLNVYYAEGKELAPNNLLKLLPGTEKMVSLIITQLKQMIESANGSLRILEVGTRDINITKMILEALKGDDIEYICSDSSLFFLNEAKNLSVGNIPVQFEIIDLEKDICKVNGNFDCIIAINSLHRMHKKETVLKNIKQLLSADGLLMFLELTIQTCLQDITAQILENDRLLDREITILDAKQWSETLLSNGFDKVFVYPKDVSLYGSNLFVAMSTSGAYCLNTKYVNAIINEKLPEYMIPKVYYTIKKFPLNRNGKIDKKQLKAIANVQIKKNPILEPVTETEKKLCAIWKDMFQIERVSTYDNYYLLGGDSLIATRILMRIKEEFQVDFTLRDLMGRKTVHEQAERLDELLMSNNKTITEELMQIKPDKVNENKPFPLTEVQQAYWIGRNGMYDLGKVSTHCYFELDGQDVNIEQMQKTWNEMIQYHGMMRVVILPSGEQQILREVPQYQIEIINLEQLSDSVAQSELKRIRTEMSHQVIEMERWPLFDVRLSVLSEKNFRLHISFDNLIFDGWSMFHLLSEWAERYRNELIAPPKLEISFRDYVLGLEAIKKSDAYRKDREYWMERINNLSKAPELPHAKKESDIQNQRFNRRMAYLNFYEWENLKKYAKKYEITPTVLLITVYGEVLRRWSANKSFTLNITQFDRKPLHPQVNELIGDFTTLTLLEMKMGQEINLLERMRAVQRQLIQDLDHTLYSAIEIERELRKISGNLKGSIMPVVFTSGLGVDRWSDEKWIGKLVYNVSQTPQVWLDHQVVEHNGGLGLFWDSVDELFYPGMLDEMFEAYVKLLKDLAAHKEMFISKISDLVDVPITEMRKESNQTERIFVNKTLDELFLETSQKFPSSIAIVSGKTRITYRQLKEKALYVCRQLQQIHTAKEELVAILMDKGWEQIVASLGILFAGAAYLPLDVENPEERLRKILESGNIKTILVKREFWEQQKWLKTWNCIVVNGVNTESDVSIIMRKDSSALAYTIYTSGSTGIPKGVMISHKGAVNTILDINSRYDVCSEDSVLAISSLHFDLSVYDIFGMLAVGGKIVIPDHKKLKDPGHWIELIKCEMITIWNSVPAFMEMLVEYECAHNLLSENSIRLILMSGDWIPITLSERIRRYLKPVKIVGLGGATEASIWSNYCEIPIEIPTDWKSIPYGKPLSNQRYYVLDEQLCQCPDWVPGTLYIAGTGLAEGYVNDKDKTNEKFIYHPELKERLYCTGDMGRYWKNGNIEFLGRTDNQVKINGYRVELGEIENIIKQFHGIRAAVVDCLKINEKQQLIAGVVFEETVPEVDESALRQYLEQKLPSYMIPGIIKRFLEIPLSSNGKIDRKRICSMFSTEQNEIKERENLTKEQRVIKKLWSSVLKTEEIGIQTNFFELGGSSLQAIQLLNMINDYFKKDFGIEVIFENPTISQMAIEIFKFIECR